MQTPSTQKTWQPDLPRSLLAEWCVALDLPQTWAMSSQAAHVVDCRYLSSLFYPPFRCLSIPQTDHQQKCWVNSSRWLYRTARLVTENHFKSFMDQNMYLFSRKTRRATMQQVRKGPSILEIPMASTSAGVILNGTYSKWILNFFKPWRHNKGMEEIIRVPFLDKTVFCLCQKDSRSRHEQFLRLECEAASFPDVDLRDQLYIPPLTMLQQIEWRGDGSRTTQWALGTHRGTKGEILAGSFHTHNDRCKGYCQPCVPDN